MKYRCLIVDDEPLALDLLETHISVIEELELIGRCSNALEAPAFLRQYEVDILFLDIQMPMISGIEFIKTLSNPPKIIMTTAYKEFAYEAFQLDVAGYLLKPITLESFLTTINKVLSSELVHTSSPDNHREFEQPFVYLKTAKKSIKVTLTEIIYIESLKDYVRVVTERGNFIVHHRIGHLESRLPENRFLRIHRSFIVALQKITSYTKTRVEMEEKSIPIGGHYKDQILAILNEKRL
ncbi:MAG: LytTR family DNA-binding domain-containing protein [Bacteroidota bacterium]